MLNKQDNLAGNKGKWAGIYTEESTRWLENSPGEGNEVIAGKRRVVALVLQVTGYSFRRCFYPSV